MSERELSDWIGEYLKYAEFTEPPIAYHRWTAVGCIAAALQRRVYMDWGMDRIYPNLYIVLLGPAAQTRKSTALRIGESFIKDVGGIPMIGQDNSPEAVIREIKKSITNFADNGHMRLQSAVSCFASELAVFLGRQDVDFQAYLTDWYDCADEWKRTTKTQGIDDITGMCFNLVGAMAPDWIPHVFTPESIGGGFTSRVMFVSEYRKAKTIANPNKCPPPNGRKDKLLADLERITKMVGAYTMDDEATTFYEQWYEEDDAEMQNGVFAVPDRTFHTYCGRRATMLRKISMCIAASRRDEQIVHLEDIQEALDMMEDAERRMPGIFASVGRSGAAHQLAAIKRIITVNGSVKKSILMQTLMHDMSAEDLDGAEKTLEAAHVIKITRLPDEHDSLYELIK